MFFSFFTFVCLRSQGPKNGLLVHVFCALLVPTGPAYSIAGGRSFSAQAPQIPEIWGGQLGTYWNVYWNVLERNQMSLGGSGRALLEDGGRMPESGSGCAEAGTGPLGT